MKLTIKKDGVQIVEAEVDVFTIGFCWMAGAASSIGVGLLIAKVINWVISLF